MRKIVCFFCLFFVAPSSFGQFICTYEPTIVTGKRGLEHIENGEIFTPKGDIRALIVFVSYGAPYDSQDVPGWPENSAFPEWATNSDSKVFYNSFSEFPTDFFSDTNRVSISNYYYQMSNGSFRLIADYYPSRVVVNVSSLTKWEDIHKAVLDQISDDVNWGLYDNRTNWPCFIFDNSISLPDSNIDYIIFCHRFDNNWDTIPDCLSMTTSNGFNRPDVSDYPVGNGYRIDNSGFTFITGGENPIGTFVHETGHSVYKAPHYEGGNKVTGKYFYQSVAGWGMMHSSPNRSCAMGWERYILDWSPQISAGGIASDIASADDLAATNGIFTIRDFITTGDAIRIRVPAGDTTYQYLWLENHQCISTFDGSTHRGTFCGDSIEEYKCGLVAYVEDYSRAKDNYYNLFYNGNAIRWLSRNGDFDFGYYPTLIHPNEYCLNETFAFYKQLANPIGGQNVNELIRHDFNNNGHIEYNDGSGNSPYVINNGTKNESVALIQVDSEPPTARYYTGTGMQFQKGDKVGIARNPCVKNNPTYDTINLILGDYYLNGISFEILNQATDGSLMVKIRMDDVDIDQDVRWAAASIVLKDITTDSRPDVDVQPSVTVNIDRSGTPNRHRNPDNPGQTSSTIEDFITPTTFRCLENSYFKQEAYSTVNVINKSTLVLDSGSVYEVNDHAALNIEQSGTLVVRSGATLHVKGAGHVEVKNGAYICVENGANVILEDTLSALNLRPGCHTTLNIPVNGSLNCNCITTPNVNIASNGIIHDDYNGNRCIQNIIYTNDAYETGDAIKAGYDVCPEHPFGDVNVTNGAHVIIDAEGDVTLDNRVCVELGSSLEVR